MMKRVLTLCCVGAVLGACGFAGVAPAIDTALTGYSWSVLKDNPKLYWTFNEANDTDWAQDVVRYRTNTQLEPTLDATRAASVNANLGKTAVFDGNDLFRSAGQDVPADGPGEAVLPGAWAIEMWVKRDAGQTAGAYFVNFLGSPYTGDWPGIIYDFTADTVELWTHTGRTGGAGPVIADTSWHHVLFTVYGDGTRGVADRVDVALDGVVRTIPRNSSKVEMNLEGAIHVGAVIPNGQDGFKGAIDEMAVYDLSGMTEAEVAARTAELAAHYGMAQTAPQVDLGFVDAAGISYAVTGGAQASSYPDSTGRELVDGVFCSSGNLEAAAVGYQSTVDLYTELVFELGKTATLDSVWIDYIAGGGKWGVNAPGSFELSFSTDGVNYSTPALFDDVNNDNDAAQTYFHERRLIAEVDDVTASYVKMKINKNGTFAFLSEVQFLENLGAGPGLAGDLNGDGAVNSGDLDIVRGNWGTNNAAGDANSDGVVNSGDLDIVRANWGATAAASAVPEPAVIGMLLLGALGLCLRRR